MPLAKTGPGAGRKRWGQAKLGDMVQQQCGRSKRLPSRRGAPMPAKEKLNAANFLGSLLVAALVGGLTNSWIVFAIALAALLIANIHAGDIRR